MSWRHVVIEGYCDHPCEGGIGPRCLIHGLIEGGEKERCSKFSWASSDEREAAYFAPLLLVLWDRFREKFLWRWMND
jgi:hypothetical protein